jgi:hypothetical protein
VDQVAVNVAHLDGCAEGTNSSRLFDEVTVLVAGCPATWMHAAISFSSTSPRHLQLHLVYDTDARRGYLIHVLFCS